MSAEALCNKINKQIYFVCLYRTQCVWGAGQWPVYVIVIYIPRNVGAPEEFVERAPICSLGEVISSQKRLQVREVRELGHLIERGGSGTGLDVVDVDVAKGHLLDMGAVPHVHLAVEVCVELDC